MTRSVSSSPTRSAPTIAGYGTRAPTRRWIRTASARTLAVSRRATGRWPGVSASCPKADRSISRRQDWCSSGAVWRSDEGAGSYQPQAGRPRSAGEGDRQCLEGARLFRCRRGPAGQADRIGGRRDRPGRRPGPDRADVQAAPRQPGHRELRHRNRVSSPTSDSAQKSVSRRKPGPTFPKAPLVPGMHRLQRRAFYKRSRGTVDPGFRREAALTAIALMILAVLILSSALAAEGPRCARGDIVLWGDGRHEDTAALNGWLQGEDLVWAETGEPVGEAITGHIFRLSSAIYVLGGTGRRLDSFRLVWPERGETVTGGSVLAGEDPDQPPVVSGVEIAGGDPGEGLPIDTPEIAPRDRRYPARCAVS